MAIKRLPVKISVAARMLGTSASAIRQRKDGTNKLTLFRREGSNRLYTWDTEIESILKNDIHVVAEGVKQ
jgi:hypothetical protein